LVDASSSVRVDTPTASTVVRGARFSVQVGAEGETQIDVHAGSADVTIGDELLSLGMGERITTDAGGAYHKERVFEPNAQLVVDRIRAAWAAPGETFRLELLEDEVNQFLAATSGQPGSSMRDAQMWFVDGEARFAATLLEPAELDLSASIEMRAVDGTLDPQVRLHTAGLSLPLPDALLIQAIESSLGPFRGQLAQAEAHVEFSDVSVEEERLVVIGRKRPPG
jgi:hypothetical protein